MSRNEAQTRLELVDPCLIDQRGWPRADIRVEVTAAAVDIVNGKGHRRPSGRADYVLFAPLQPGAEPIPMAIIETKRENLPPEHGLQQGKGYRIGKLHNVPFVYSTNGHMFVEHDLDTVITSEARPMSQFPTPDELRVRVMGRRGLPAVTKEIQPLLTPYDQGREYLRYYQDASIRASLTRIIVQRANQQPPRVLLAIATGGGKTRIAAVLLHKLFKANWLGRALFVCDRTELRDNGLGDFQNIFGNDAAEVDTRNPQKNARVLIATYQTLDKSQGGDDATFFLKHYPPGYFDVIVIDECHRSAWGDWHVILEQNKQAIQIGLTATPRQLEFHLPETADEATRKTVEEERRRLADNYRYFGDPVYEYSYLQGVEDGYLAPVDIEQWDLYHDWQQQPERVRGVLRDDLEGKQLTNAITGAVVATDDVAPRTEGAAIEQRLIMPDRVTAMSAHLFERLLATGDGDPLQKTIVFCASDHHADLVTNELNNIYARWCAANGKKRAATYAFKCMSSVNGQALIPIFRGRQSTHFVATTKELLSTGVNVPCVRNIVFFRYLQSPILFHQMVGRGTRIDAGTGKLMFRIFDYTGATALFGTEFKTPPPPSPRPEPPPEPPPDPQAPTKAKGFQIAVQSVGNFNLLSVDGKVTRVTREQYRQRLIDELTQLVPTLRDFRQRWLVPGERQEMLKQLRDKGLVPETIRTTELQNYDEFDVLAALAYGIQPLTRQQRAARFGDTGPDWLIRLPQPSAKVIRAIVRQFEQSGTGALEAPDLWRTPEMQELRGLDALRQGGPPADLLRKTKETLFAA
jgi:type I restriction enzyme R subunit